jgi:Zn-dependent protease
MVAGPADKQTMGRSASAGPATNIVLASMFSVAALASPGFGGALGIIAWFNAWIAVFNLIPFAIFDGAKVFSWNRKVWALMFVLSGAMTAVLTFVFLTGP